MGMCSGETEMSWRRWSLGREGCIRVQEARRKDLGILPTSQRVRGS